MNNPSICNALCFFIIRPRVAKVLDLFFPQKEDSNRSLDYLIIAESILKRKVMIRVFYMLILYVIVINMAVGQVNTIRIDPENAKGAGVSQLFDSVEYIPLENSPESEFGRVDKLFVTSDFFYILDHSTDAIYLFKKNGQFFNKVELVHWIKTPNRQELGIRDFMVNELTGNLIVSHWQKQGNLYFFSPKGVLLKVLKHNSWLSYGNIDDSHYLVESMDDIKDTINNIFGSCIVTDSSFTLKKGFLKELHSDFNITAGSNLMHASNSKSAIYTRSFDYNAYVFGAEGLKETIKFIFPYSYSLPSDFLDSVYSHKRADYLSQNRNVIYSISDIYRVQNLLLFDVNRRNPSRLHVPLLYDLRTKVCYDLGKISPDSSNNFLPLLGDQTIRVLAADTSSFYLSVPSYKLFKSFNDNKKRSNNYSQRMLKYFASQTSRSNPVIVRIIPKRN